MEEGVSAVKKSGATLFLRTIAQIEILRSRIEMFKLHYRLKDHYRDLGERFMDVLEKGKGTFSKDEIREIIDRIDSILMEEAKQKQEMKSLKNIKKRQEWKDETEK